MSQALSRVTKVCSLPLLINFILKPYTSNFKFVWGQLGWMVKDWNHVPDSLVQLTGLSGWGPRTQDLKQNKTKQSSFFFPLLLNFHNSNLYIYISIYQVQVIPLLYWAPEGALLPTASSCYLKPPFLGPGVLPTILWKPLQHGVVALTSGRPPNLKKFPSNLWHFLEGLTCLCKLALTFLTQISLNLIPTFLVVPQHTCSGQFLLCLSY